MADVNTPEEEACDVYGKEIDEVCSVFRSPCPSLSLSECLYDAQDRWEGFFFFFSLTRVWRVSFSLYLRAAYLTHSALFLPPFLLLLLVTFASSKARKHMQPSRQASYSRRKNTVVHAQEETQTESRQASSFLSL